jgi:cell division transport system ATP-binding protein
VIARPSLLLADEPTGNVDDVIGLRLMYLFEELNRLGTTVVIATHNDTLVSRFSHRQLRIEDGSIRVFDPRPMTAFPSTQAPTQTPTGSSGTSATTPARRPGTA